MGIRSQASFDRYQMEVSVLYEDNDLLVLDKPAGVSVLADRGSDRCFLDILTERWGEKGERPLVVHRLDKGTSGAIIFAKGSDAARAVSTQFETRTVKKTYLALVSGRPVPPEGTIDIPLAPHPGKPGIVVANAGRGKPALTFYRVIESFCSCSLVEARPQTGRTHQIRVHFKVLGYPLAVDPVYGGQSALYLSAFRRGYRPSPRRPEKPLLDRLSLHASAIEVRHPVTGEAVRFEAPLPQDFRITMRQLRKYG